MKCGLTGEREEVIGGACSEFRVLKNAHLLIRLRNSENRTAILLIYRKTSVNTKQHNKRRRIYTVG